MALTPFDKAWTKGQRRRLSASITPHRNDPADLYHDAASAIEALCALERPPEDLQSVPAALTIEGERERLAFLTSRVGISWKESTGRIFTDEYWNPLIGLWLDKGGWDFVLEMLFPNPERPGLKLPNASGHDQWLGVRRYLYRADEATYGAFREKIAPLYERLGDTYEERQVCEAIAFAFSRDGEWMNASMRGHLTNPDQQPIPQELDRCMAGTTDEELLQQLVERNTPPPTHGNVNSGFIRA